MADGRRFSLGQPRAAFGILAIANVSFAGFLVFGNGPWIPEALTLLCLNLALAAWCVRMAIRDVRTNDLGVIVINAFATHRLPWSQIRRFRAVPPNRFSRLAREPAVELNNGSTIRLTALIPFYKPTAANSDIDATLHALNSQLTRHQVASPSDRPRSEPDK